MELLIKRDGNHLVKTEGKVDVDADIPDYLRVPRVVSSEDITKQHNRSSSDDLLIENETDYKEIKEHLSFNPHLEDVPGLWSGYRSTILQDPTSKKWFRIKGVALDPYNPEIKEYEDGGIKIIGGQGKQNVEYERVMSNKFNKTLENEGIEPVMKVRGMWRYPVLVKRVRPTASIVEIKGDTRLDELMLVTDGLMSRKMYIDSETTDSDGNPVFHIGVLTPNGKKFRKSSRRLYQNIGFSVGRLKRLMDKNDQTWSSDSEQSNAHVGNIVVYNGTDKLKVGLVDFDVSCDRRDFTKPELKALQKREYESIIGSVEGTISPRQMSGLPFTGKIIFDPGVKKRFIKGFMKGYDSTSRTYTNEVDLGELQEVFELLRQSGEFSLAPRGSYDGIKLEHLIDNYDKIDLHNIVDKQYSFQKGSYNTKDSLNNDYSINHKSKLEKYII